MTVLAVAVVGFALYCFQAFGEAADFGLLSLLPTAVVIFTALYTKRTIESLFIGVLVGLLMTNSPADFIPQLGTTFLDVFMNDTVAWIFIACGLMGSMISLVTIGGGAEAFGRWLTTRVHSRKGTLFSTMALGLAIFIDDYLNALTIGSSMRKATDKKKVSREFLAYVVDSTAAPVCIILPFSTWAVFFAGLLEDNEVAAKGAGIDLFIDSIPYMLYAWVCLVVVVLAISGKLPLLGKMKDAEKRAASGKLVSDADAVYNTELEGGVEKSNMLNFFVPILSLIFFTWYFDIDIMSGAMASIFVTLAFFGLQRLMSMGQMFDGILKGFVGMIMPLGTLFCGFMLAEVNNALGTTEYVINATTGFMTADMLPMVAFVVMAALAFATASFWGIFVVGMPIILPLAVAVDANIPLVVGAMISASAFGSHACFYGDSTVLSAKACGISPMSHAITQLPYALIGGVISAIGFLMLGIML
ncbi:sodium:proton antiporter [Marinobacterium nitratireducens]|uniref:Sodium:proton antiporter n=1 Tax=Marinobacterium nitratireducens TaxID=518897 RepID=A0A917ZDM5_9GAMM|nr:sodium:proton antiporter [Marinobacterium nitratireducens]